MKNDVEIYSGTVTTITLEMFGEAMVDKPNLYLYPGNHHQMFRSAWELSEGCGITQSIPAYGEGWDVVAEPSGLLDGQYGYLFYESEIPANFGVREGWSVPSENLGGVLRGNLVRFWA